MGEEIPLLESELDALRREHTRGYEQEPIPVELDARISRLVNTFINASEQQRERIIALITIKHSFTLLQFSERMAVLAVREDSRKLLLEALLALVIEDFKYDWRDSLMRFTLINHSAEKIGTQPARLFAEAAAYAHPEVAEALLKFPARSPASKSLEAMKYRESFGPDGFEYSRIL